MSKWTMSKLILAVITLAFGVALIATEADAKRLGGGRSVGTQRNVTAPPAATPAKPAQQAAPQQQGSKWGMLGGILGGLALGGLLGYMLSGQGLGTMLLLVLLVVAAVVAMRALRRRQEAPGAQTVQYANGMGEERISLPAGGVSATPAAAAKIPPGFDTAGFLRSAKLNFVKLQLANDAGNLDEIRDFTTGEMFDELKKDALQRPGGAQDTDVVSLDADLLELATESEQHWASVRFSGMVREAGDSAPVGFEEVWNLVKPARGSSGWLLAGIQQMH